MATRRGRIQAVPAGERADELSAASWRHRSSDDHDAAGLAEVTIASHPRFD